MEAPRIIGPQSALGMLGLEGVAIDFEHDTELMAGPAGGIEKRVIAVLPAHSMVLVLPPATAAHLRPHLKRVPAAKSSEAQPPKSNGPPT